jgi:flavin reductase (DIM6/NTAB) family NADH-FMN oxidoreductase RutF
MAVDSLKFRQVLGHFATGVVVCTTHFNKKNHGITINSFASVSLDPALVMFCLSKKSSEYEIFSKAKGFCANILAADQQELSNHFASQSRNDWSNIGFVKNSCNYPMLNGSLVHINCRVWQKYNGGDHDIIIGEVNDLDVVKDSEPLLYYRSDYYQQNMGKFKQSA